MDVAECEMEIFQRTERSALRVMCVVQLKDKEELRT